MKLITYFLTVACVAMLALTACENDDTDFSDIIGQQSSGGDDEGDDEPTKTYDIKTIELDDSDLSETETIPEDDNDYVENSDFDYQVYVAFDGNSATVTGDVSRVTVAQNGGHVTITTTKKDIEYILSGSTTDGSFKVYSEHKYKLTLNGVSITNPTGAAINNQCGKSLYVVLADGTTNTLTDGTSYAATVNEDMRGTFFSEGQIIFSGSGRLNVYANCKNGIASDDYIRFRPGNKIYIKNTANNGVKAKDGIFVNGGVLNIEVSGKGSKGLNSELGVEVSGGRTTIITTGGSAVESNDTTSSAGIKCDSTYTQKAGIVNIKSSGEGAKGVNSNQCVVVSGGELNVVTLGAKQYASPKGIKADEDITISGGSTYSYSASASPLDAKRTLTVSPGYKTYTKDERLAEIYY